MWKHGYNLNCATIGVLETWRMVSLRILKNMCMYKSGEYVSFRELILVFVFGVASTIKALIMLKSVTLEYSTKNIHH